MCLIGRILKVNDLLKFLWGFVDKLNDFSFPHKRAVPTAGFYRNRKTSGFDDFNASFVVDLHINQGISNPDFTFCAMRFPGVDSD